MLEMSRYAMATGESIFTGAARVFKPLMWFFFVAAALIYIWPGHMSAGAGAFENLTGIPWQVTGTIALIAVAVVFTLARVIYDLLENVLGVTIGLLVIGSAVTAAMVGNLGDLGDTLTGMFAFGFVPDGMMTAAWFPVVVGSIAFAGPSGMQQMWYTLHLRESGAAMGSHIPKMPGLAHAKESDVKAMPARGFMFDTEDSAEMEKWKGWRKWVTFDAFVLFWGVTMLVTIAFTVMALKAAELSPEVRETLLEGDRDAALPAMADAFASAGGEALGWLFLGFISLVGLNATLALFDSFSRGQADMVFNNIKGAKKIGMPRLYGAVPLGRGDLRDHHRQLGSGGRTDSGPGHVGVPVDLRDGGLLRDIAAGEQPDPAQADPAEHPLQCHHRDRSDVLPRDAVLQRHRLRRRGHGLMEPT